MTNSIWLDLDDVTIHVEFEAEDFSATQLVKVIDFMTNIWSTVMSNHVSRVPARAITVQIDGKKKEE